MHESAMPICAWLSRHPPSLAQRASLDGYRIVQLQDRWPSAEAAWERVTEVCIGRPELIVAIMPTAILIQFVCMVAPTKVIRPKQIYGNSTHWAGKWQELKVESRVAFCPWIPNTEGAL